MQKTFTTRKKMKLKKKQKKEEPALQDRDKGEAALDLQQRDPIMKKKNNLSISRMKKREWCMMMMMIPFT
jgi:hypothetical protein